MDTASLDSISIIPKPAKMERLASSFRLHRSTPVWIAPSASAGAPAARFLRKKLHLMGNAPADDERCPDLAIQFRHSSIQRGSEGYLLLITPRSVILEASSAAGWFYAVQTLLQVLPPTAAQSLAGQPGPPLPLPCVRIEDQPRFPWRGLMIDVSRHLMPVDGLLRLLDNMAAHKLNTFHWHLTDDQGWRLQSVRYPQLTDIGAWRHGADGTLTPSRAPLQPPGEGTYGGFYTHDDVRTVVARAAELHIRIVPEIEMPGHVLASLAAYPELSCTGSQQEPATRAGVCKDVYCAGSEAPFEFLQNVLSEVISLFPGEYIHVGGDECPKDRWRNCPRCQARIKAEGLKDEEELQSYFIRRMQTFLAMHDRKLIGWDEILQGGLAPGATVMSWRGTEGGIAAAKANHDAVMTPHTYCYLDYRQAPDGEPLAMGDGMTPLEKTYSYEPVPAELSAEDARYILGVQGNLWTEFVTDIQHAEYMIWPRAAAIAELGWSSGDDKNFAEFQDRVIMNEARLAISGSSFRPIRREPHEAPEKRLSQATASVGHRR